MREFRAREFWCCALMVGLLGAPAAVRADGLRDALRATLRNHPVVAGQEAEVEARRYSADGARSQRYPTLTAQAQHYAQSSRSVIAGEDLSHPAVLRVRQPVWSFGRINNTIAHADAEVNTERADLLRVRRQLLEDTAVAYAEVHASRERVDIARQNVIQLEALHAQIERRAAGQFASRADARLGATRLVQARVLLEHAISGWEGSQQDLFRLTQEPVSIDQPVPAELLELRDAADLIERAMDHSAEIRFKQRQLGQAEAAVGRAKTSLMPTVYLQADRFYDQPGLRDDSQVSVVIEGSLDGLGFAARGRTGEAVASRMAATQRLAAARLELMRELERLQRNRRLQIQLIALQTQSVTDLESLLVSYQRQFESGAKSWLDLLNIQRELFEQRRQLAQAKSDSVNASLQLLAMTGGLDGLAGIDERDDD